MVRKQWLSAFPSALGLEVNNVELAKGYFPHFFNRPENWNAVLDKLPDEKYYGVDSMKTDSLKKFREWYAAHEHDKFDFQKEIKQYCHLDVEILQKGCLKFRQLIKSVSHDLHIQTHDLDPFTASTTIASLCMRIFRQNFMEENTIGIPPDKGYRSRDTQSALAIKYLRWIEHTKGIQIKHAGNSGEASISTAGHTYKIDGQEVDNPQNLWEINGCLWHGHSCIKRQTVLPRSNLTAGQAYERTMKRLEQLQDAGFHVNVRWECEIRAEMRANREMAEYMGQQKKYEPLDPRDAFYGGRTNTRKLHHKVSEDEKIHYVDVCSLYPWVLKYGEFPKGHPEVITEKFDDINMRTYRGLIKCLVLPPQHLLHPVLPLKMDSKLLFPLCYECAKLKDNECEHTPEQRQFWGTWATMELYEAMDQGYKVIEIAEVYHFDEWMEAGDGPFTGYINSFLKTKVEASGYPRGCDTDEQKAQYIADYKAKEDVQLDAANIAKNPGLRATAKLCLNSFWGKFGQRPTLSKQKFITESDQFFKMLTDDTIIVEAVDVITDELLSVTYQAADGFVEELPSTNVIYASIVTAQARLKLYSYLKEVENNVLYFDTDSVIYLSTPGSPVLPVGEHLGDLTCELDGDYITEFVSCGPKQYAFKTSKGQCVEKIRGFTLTDEASKLLNFNSMKKIVDDYMQSVNTKIDIKFTQIARKQHNVVVTQAAKKTYQFVFDKCVIAPDMVCYPYGYIQ